MRVLLAFALLLGFSLTTTASAADWDATPEATVEVMTFDGAMAAADALGATVNVYESAAAEEAAAPCLVVITEYYVNGELVLTTIDIYC